MSVRFPTAGAWFSSQWRPDNEFETDRVQKAQRPAKIAPSAVREHFVEQDIIAVTRMYVDTMISGRQTTQVRGPASFKREYSVRAGPFSGRIRVLEEIPCR